MERILKSIFWLIAFSGTGYGLFVGLTPSDEKINKFRKEFSGSSQSAAEVRSKNQKFLDILQSAASSDKPVYRMNKEEREKLREK